MQLRSRREILARFLEQKARKIGFHNFIKVQEPIFSRGKEPLNLDRWTNLKLK